MSVLLNRKPQVALDRHQHRILKLPKGNQLAPCVAHWQIDATTSSHRNVHNLDNTNKQSSMPPEQNGTDLKCTSGENMTTRIKTEHDSINDNDMDASFPSAPTNPTNSSCHLNNNALGLDAAEVFRASLEFQQMESPPLTSLDERATSSSSLYPSLEFVSRLGGDIELERSWHDGAVAWAPSDGESRGIENTYTDSSQLKRAARSYRIQQKAKDRKLGARDMETSSDHLASNQESVPAQAANLASFPARASVARANDDEDLIALKRAAYGGDYSSSSVHQIEDDYTRQYSRSTEQQAEAFVVEENVHPSDIEVDAVHAEFVTHNSDIFASNANNSRSYAAAGEYIPSENSIHAVAAPLTDSAEATVIESGPADKATPEAWSAAPAAEATVLHESDFSCETDRKPPAVDFSEAWTSNDALHSGNSQGSHSAVASSSQEPETGIVDHNGHPFQFSYSTSQAETAEGSSSAPATVVDCDAHPQDISYVATRAHGNPNSYEESFQQEAEATIVDYDVHPSQMSSDSIHAELSHPVDSVNRDAEATVVDYDVYQSDMSHDATHAELQESPSSAHHFEASMEQEAEATVVDYDVHPSELSYGAVHAEFVQDIHCQSHDDESEQPRYPARVSHVTDRTQEALEVNGINLDETTEATVISSGPIDKATPEAWSAEPASEAQVIEDNAGAQQESDRKPPADTHEGGGNFAMADGEAEVVDVAEDAHPSEYHGSAAEAELIGPDYSCAIAVPSSQQENTGSNGDQGIVEEATYVVEGSTSDYSQGTPHVQIARAENHEAQATLVNGDHLDEVQYSASTHQIHSVTAVLEGDYVATDSGAFEQTATPVTVMDGGIDNSPTESFHAGTPKSDPLAVRATSAPATTRATNESENFQQNTRSYSCGEHQSPNNDNMHASAGPGRDGFPPLPPQAPPSLVSSTTSRLSRSSSRSDSLNGHSGGLQSFSSNFCRGTNNVMEMLFGNNKNSERHLPAGFDSESLAGSILPRSPLPSSVIFSEATNSWVATVNTNQKALEANNVEESSKALRAFSVPTKKQAIALARAWAPPRMLPFESNQRCFICETQFAVFRRACHCRNCGVVICGSCVVQWPAKMLPATYNSKKESFMKICKGCDWLCSAFRLSLLHGEHDKAVALHSTGNINLTTPFANVKGELFYPVHCAVLGGNLKLLKWLVDEHCCPLRSIRISHGKEKDASGSYTPILTSKGRSLLGIALSNRNIGIVRYLVAEKRMLLSAEKNLSIDTLAQNLDLVLRVLPEEVLGEQDFDASERSEAKEVAMWSAKPQGNTDSTNVSGEVATAESECTDINATRRSMEGAVPDFEECIICFSNEINCVATPCGHQICCLECSRNISRCPVCAAECSFLRVFKP